MFKALGRNPPPGSAGICDTPGVDPLARLAAALDPVMRTARTPGERVAVMRAAWAAAKLVLDAAPAEERPRAKA